MAQNTSFAVPEEFGGKSLSQLQREGKQVGRADILAGFLGIKPETQLRSGQIFDVGNIPGVDPAGSAELQFLSRAFRPGNEVRREQATQRAQEAIQPAVETLRKGQDPLKDQYNKLIESIRGKGAEAERQAEIGAARSFASRGLTTTDPGFAKFQQQFTAPVQAQFAGLAERAGVEGRQAQNAILSAIAQLQGQAGFTGIESAFAERRLAQQQRQFDLAQQLAREQFREPQQAQDDPFARFAKVGEGQTIFDLSTGKSIFKNPKTFKESIQEQLGGFNEDDYE